MSDHTSPDQTNRRDLRESLTLSLKGFLMGAADIIPGVSGGTMALITGIYEPLLRTIRSVDHRVVLDLMRLRVREVAGRLDLAFLAWIVLGIGGAIVFFTRVVPLQRYMMSHPELVYGLFFGLILGSIAILLLEVRPSREQWRSVLGIPFGATIGFWVVTLVPTDTPEAPWFLFLSGMVAISAMILPGISGSFILLILRKYDFVLAQIGALGGFYTLEALMALIPFAFGALAGLALFSRLLSWLLERAHAPTMMVLVGFLIGSLWVIWPWQVREYAESIRETREYAYTAPEVQELLQAEPDPYALRFRRVGRVLNPGAGFDELKRVEVEEVSRKLISSHPYWPGASPARDAPSAPSTTSPAGSPTEAKHPIGEGLGGMAAGLLLTALVQRLRRVRGT